VKGPRTRELLLLAAVAPIVLLVFALVQAQASKSLTASDLIAPAGLVLAFVAAHVAVRLTAPGADPVLLPIAALLSGIGIAFVTRLNPALGRSQVVWLLAGVAVLVITLVTVRSLETLARFKYTIMLIGIGLLILPALVGHEVNGAKLWLRFGSLSFQPGEIAKILVVLFLAAYLAENRELLSISTRRVFGVWVPPLKQLGPLLLMWAISLFVLIAEKDLGSSLLFFGIFLVMIYAATGRISYVLAGVVLFGVGAAAAYFAFAHVHTRIDIWLHPFAEAAGRGYQLVQSLFALAAGGVSGVGVGRGFPGRIPSVETDFIFAAVGEELGLLGGAALIVAYAAFCLRGLATAARARSDMGALTATGLVAALGLQTFVIIGGVTRLVPLTGVTLPFVSYGGSSILANFILLGLLLRTGDESTGVESEMQTTVGDIGVLGRVALSRRLVRVAEVLAVLLVALVVNLTYVQVVRASWFRNNPANTRLLAEEARSDRGAILTSDGVVLAESVPSGTGTFSRDYPAGSLAAHLVGYVSATYGRTGVEQAANETLSGTRVFSSINDVIDAAAGLPLTGNDIVLTVDSSVQKAAQSALAGHRGACVVLDPRSGAVLAMASTPSYAPTSIDSAWKKLTADKSAPLVSRATQSLYPPGSTFKVVTLTGALGDGIATPKTTYSGPGRIVIGGAPVTNFEGGSYGKLDLATALAKSVNTVFAQLAVNLGAKRLVGQADAFGFDHAVPFELPVKTSLMPDPDEMTTWETAWAGVGQPVGEHKSPAGPQVTALQMSLVAAGIANGGVVMQPYVIKSVHDEAGRVLSTTPDRDWLTATDSATAATMRELMVGVVDHGSGTRARISGIKVAGKTGTAEAGKSVQTHAWFIAFAPADDPIVAMAIVLENAGVGGRVAAPAAKRVLEAALNAQTPR
jgi:cell division protein FtsI/penicillin-binding protein 2/cell division protein FtsW (lipid II flippase)